MPDRKPDLNSEQQRQIATEIYGKLQVLRGTTKLDGFNHGEVIFPEAGKRIVVAGLSPLSEPERKFFRHIGFTDEDFDSGITAFIEYEFLNPNWPLESFVAEPQTDYLNVSGTGKAFRIESADGKSFNASQLRPNEMDALRRANQLSMIPRQIWEIFGSYEVFVEFVKDFDPTGIDRAELKPIQIMYNGGLSQFVRALSLKQQGQLGKLDTDLHALKDSLDSRDHFTKLFETLQNYRDARSAQN